jgi:hypothetical protein
MVVETIERTGLWRRAFSYVHDGNDAARHRYASALFLFRERVGKLLTFIPGDMRHYTVHDLSHLDALWEMADMICGEEFHLNPAEAFVFGASVLLHDAGMTIAAYPGGIEELNRTPEWEDARSIANKYCLTNNRSSANCEAQAATFAITEVLRLNHAKKAEELASQYWLNPLDQSHEYLLENSELRAHFGAAIGAIAHSHHWNIARLLTDLQQTLGAFSDTPGDWAVDCIKVALLLRCADAAHIDHRRAPRLLLSMTRPSGVSLTHWSFQSKLAKPQVRNGKLLYTSRSPFSLQEVEAWQLCWDVMKMIDRELSDSCDVLVDRKSDAFNVCGVVGAKSAVELAKHVAVDGWRPILTEIQVSDVPSLARTLGGRDLYSSNIAPLRELIQNAADAIDARIAIDPDFSLEEAKITVRVAGHGNDVAVSVEDNGIGMSEKTMTGALIDFGLSFWRSEAVRHEFPGLQAKFKPRGRYGIGFFSVFMWADNVKISSRKFTEGIADARILEFGDGLSRRPILRPAANGESSNRFFTKVTLCVPTEKWSQICADPEDHERLSRYVPNRRVNLNPDRSVALISGMLRIPVYFDDCASMKRVNFPEWESASTEHFIAFLEKTIPGEFSEEQKRFARAEAKINSYGKVIGRAFLMPSIDRSFGSLAVYEQGIFVAYQPAKNVVGFIEGRARNAARDRAEVHNLVQDEEWFAKQMDYMSRIVNNVGEAIVCQEACLSFDRIVRDLPLFLLNRKECSLAELVASAGKMKKIRMTLRTDRAEGEFAAEKVDSAAPFIGKKVDEEKIFFLASLPGKISNEDRVAEFIESSQAPLAQVIRELKQVFGPDADLKVSVTDADSYSRKQSMHIEVCRTLGRILPEST